MRLDFQLETSHSIDPLHLTGRWPDFEWRPMNDELSQKFSDSLENIKLLLAKTKIIESSEQMKLISYYFALYQCVEFIRFDKTKIVRMKSNFQDMHKLISANLYRLWHRIRTEDVEVIRAESDSLIKYLSEMFIKISSEE